MTILKYAWRNLWRNKQRTAITLAAITLNTAILIISYSLMEGMLRHTIHNVTNMIVGEVQVHAESYKKDRSIYKSLPNPEAILDAALKHGVPAAKRSYGYGLISSGSKSAGASFWGIDPRKELQVFDLGNNLQEGRFLAATPSREIVLGRKLARSLHASVGSELVVVVQAADGSLGNELFTVSGILKTVGDTVDRGAAIIHHQDFKELFVSNNRVHEIAMNTKGAMEINELAALIVLSAGGAEVRTWRELLPMLSDMVNIFDVVIWVFYAIFFLAAGLGVMNTMLMATYERMREFGIMKALGTSPMRIIGNMAAEAFVLTASAALLGSILGLTGSYILQEVGIDTSVFSDGFSFSGIAFDPIWKASISIKGVIIPVAVMCIVCTAASLYPAVIAARLDPVKAIHHV